MQQRAADSGSIIITRYTQVEGGCLGLGFQASPFRRDNQFHPKHGHHKSLPGYPSHISFACCSLIGRVTQQAAGPNAIELSPRCTEYTGSEKRKFHPQGCVMILSSKYEWLIGGPGRGAEQTDSLISTRGLRLRPRCKCLPTSESRRRKCQCEIPRGKK